MGWLRKWGVYGLILGVLVWLHAGVWAQEPSAPASAPLLVSDATGSEAILTLGNRPITSFRVPFLGMSPQERVRRAQLNVEQALARGGKGVVTSKLTPQGELIFVDDMMVITLTPGDVPPMSNDSLDSLGDRAAQALQVSVKETLESRDTHTLLMGLVWVGLATGFAILAFWLGTMARGRVLPWLLNLVERKTAALGIGASEILRRDRLLTLIEWFDLAIRWGFGLLLVYAWLSFVLLQFPFTRPWGEGLHHYLTTMVWGLARRMLGAVPGLVVAAMILLIARAAVGIMSSLFTRVEQGHIRVRWLDPETARPTRRVATWLIWLFGLAMAYPYLPGAQTEAFKGMSVLIGVMMSLGASSFVGQVAGGLILTYSSMLKKGEYVRIGDHEGTVVSIGAFNTRIRTGVGEEVTLPNSMIVGNATKNYSRAVKGDGYVVDTVVTIGYDTPWRQVHAMLIEAALRTEGVLSDPPPKVFQTSLSDFYPEYRLVCQALPTAPNIRAQVLTQLHAHIQDVFNEYGVQIMSPHYMLDPAHEKVVPKERWFAEPAQPQPAQDATRT